ncbi:BppU family phage baseplate upper protein [Mammaliicoccus sp. F-M27]|uniref:BppU family phage baseplate upper protein n=1 Tax=Mammaliicoccus sp. F-M27 TaxID=2898687 RepID=UPI001EFA6221|nr:BppU family phage baseplate upper protein [Mammaliicoccus sp. F-M27]
MAIYKNKDIETNINERDAELGNINVNFYTEDNGTASIRISIKNQQGVPINFSNTDMLPRLDLYAKDGSIFTKEPIEIILAEQGLIQYKVSDYVIRHEGKMDCKLFLENSIESVHVANFYFVIKDSGVTGAIGKEIHVDVLEDMVRNTVLSNKDKFVVPPKMYTRDEYNQLSTKDSNTLYFISEV